MNCKYCGGSLEFSLVADKEGNFCSEECLNNFYSEKKLSKFEMDYNEDVKTLNEVNRK